MLYRDALIVDYGPKFKGAAALVGEGIACLVPIQARVRPQVQEVQATMRELVRDLGGECGQCRNCPIGREG